MQTSEQLIEYPIYMLWVLVQTGLLQLNELSHSLVYAPLSFTK